MAHPPQDPPQQPTSDGKRTAFRASGGISLIIPLQDEERSVAALIQSINGQSLSPDEVVIVDAGSTDETIRRANAVPTRAPMRIVPAGRVHPGVARNTGAAASGLDWLAFTDGGVVLERDWLAELAAAATEGAAVVFGSYEPVCDTFFKQCAALAYVPRKGSQGARGPSVASCLVRRSAFEAIGGFPPYRAAEDLIFIKRLEESGFGQAFAPRAVVHWQIAADPRGTYARFAAYSYHNLIAGWGRYWHLGVARLYGLLGLSVAIAVALGLGLWASLLLPGFFIGRALKAAWVKRGSFGFPTLDARRVAGTAIVLAIVDAATLSGCFRWLFSTFAGRRPSSAGIDRERR
jgi:glycosyltransferase involved in cell wall biosynthesis